MAEYIDRGVAIARLTALEVTNKIATLTDAKRRLADMPAADVAPVVHGRFVHNGPRLADYIDWWHCSNCGRQAAGVETRFAYCPNCGARMDGGAGNAADRREKT